MTIHKRRKSMSFTVPDVLDDYTPPQKKKLPVLHLRVSPELEADLQLAVRLWRENARARGDAEKSIDLPHVVRDLLGAGIKRAFAGIGLKPTNEEEWREAIRVIQKTAKK